MAGPGERHYHVYILSNYTNSVVYTGVTNNLLLRVQQHRDGFAESFTKRYRVWKLVHYEVAENIEAAILREKQIKSWSRKRKENLIRESNPQWRDLFAQLVDSDLPPRIATPLPSVDGSQ